MFLEMHLRFRRMSNNWNTSGFLWQHLDFAECEGLETGKYIWAVCTTLCFAVGLPASVAILWEMFKTHRRGTSFTPNDFFILNLTIMDVVFLVFIPPGVLNHFIFKSSLLEASWNGFFAFNSCGRPLLMACICLDCYLAVVHPITYLKRKRLAPRAVMVGIVWTLTIASGIAYFLFFWLYYTVFPTVPFLIAIVIIGICDCFIFHTLRKSDPSRKNIHPQKQRAIQTLIYSLAMTVVSYLPPVLLLTLGESLITDTRTFICIIGIPITITSTLGSAVMPILYLYNVGKLDCLKLGCCKS